MRYSIKQELVILFLAVVLVVCLSSAIPYHMLPNFGIDEDFLFAGSLSHEIIRVLIDFFELLLFEIFFEFSQDLKLLCL